MNEFLARVLCREALCIFVAAAHDSRIEDPESIYLKDSYTFEELTAINRQQSFIDIVPDKENWHEFPVYRMSELWLLDSIHKLQRHIGTAAKSFELERPIDAICWTESFHGWWMRCVISYSHNRACHVLRFDMNYEVPA